YLVEHRRTGSPHWVRATPSLVPLPELTLSGLEPGWRYQFRVSAQNAVGLSEPGDVSEPLTVTLHRSTSAAPHFAEFRVVFRGTPAPKVAWYKDGFEIFSSRRMRVLTEGDQSSLIIYQSGFSDEGDIKCTATNRVGHVVTKAKLRLE
ncbi:Protein amalgam, partial [Gryllus bimaculatus]